jgi:hypothetical protein
MFSLYRAQQLIATIPSRNGVLSSSDTNTSGTGRKRENQTPEGSAMRAVVTHDTPCSSPACNGEGCKSWRMKGETPLG